MKLHFVTFILFILISCNSTTNDKESAFKSYLNSLPKQQLPFTFSSEGNIKIPKELKYDESGFQKYKQVWATKTLGILKMTDKYVVISDLVMGDGGFGPFLMCYDLKGNKIDSLMHLKNLALIWDIVVMNM